MKALAALAVAVAATVTALAPAGAHAATAQVVVTDIGCDDADGCFTQLVFEAAPNENNNVTMARGTGAVTITDAGAPVTAGSGCSQVSTGSVRCDGEDRSVSFQLGNLSDQATVNGFATIFGGPGDDLLRSTGDGHTLFTGGGGFDTILGGPGDDQIDDGDSSTAPDSDRLDGGAGGDDELRYLSRELPVRVDLKTHAPSGAAGENDRIANFEDATGGSGDDVLIAGDGGATLFGNGGADRIIGGARQDFIYGFEGNDTLSGGGGADRIEANEGRDRVDGGTGNDRLESGADGDSIACGAGERDRGLRTGVRDRVELDCEFVTPRSQTTALTSKLPLRNLGAPIVTSRNFYCLPEDRPCTWALAVRPAGGGALMGSERVRVPRGTEPRAAGTLRLSRTGAATLSRRRRMLVQITVDKLGDRDPTGGYTVLLTAPRQR